MSRPLCLELFGGLYLVTSRGDRREDTFISTTRIASRGTTSWVPRASASTGPATPGARWPICLNPKR